MPANLPPQFFELQKQLKQVKTNQEKIEILKKMLAICPKHKGTERVQEELKKKIAKLRKILPKKTKTETLYFIKKEGAGQVLILGMPNSGKTSLVNSLCKTSFKIGDYPFTTTLPTPAMMRFENVLIQVIDAPPITKDFKPGWIKNLAKQADLILLLVDLSSNFKFQLNEILKILEEWEIEKEKVLVVGNKLDLVKEKVEIFSVSAKEERKIEELKKKIFESLRIIRVYPKEPKNGVDFQKPLILKKGTKLIDFIKEINENWLEKFKGARLYNKDLKNFQIVGRDYILKDGDIIELRI